MSSIITVKDSGKKKLVEIIDKSTGVLDAGKSPVTGLDGKLDVSLMPSGFVPFWNKETIILAPGATQSSSDIADGNFVKYFLLGEGSASAYAFEMNLFKANGTPLDIITNKIGLMNLAVNSVIDINGMHIALTNNESYTVTVTLTYMSN